MAAAPRVLAGRADVAGAGLVLTVARASTTTLRPEVQCERSRCISVDSLEVTLLMETLLALLMLLLLLVVVILAEEEDRHGPHRAAK